MGRSISSLMTCLFLSGTVLLFAGCSAVPGKPSPAASSSESVVASLPEATAAEASETASESTTVFVKISAQEAKKMMDAGGVVILDVRTQEEYAEGHIADAILLPDSEVASRAAEVLPDKEAPVLVYCRSGRRSALAAQSLKDLGYSRIYDFGGIQDWPFETVK